MCDEANRELQEIAPADRTRTEVLGMRVDVYITTEKWNMAAEIARHLVAVEPQNISWWNKLAYSIRRLDGIEKAESILLCAREVHPRSTIIVFNLACCASVSGRIAEARERLKEAIEIDHDLREFVLDDEDLRPLWNWITTLD